MRQAPGEVNVLNFVIVAVCCLVYFGRSHASLWSQFLHSNPIFAEKNELRGKKNEGRVSSKQGTPRLRAGVLPSDTFYARTFSTCQSVATLFAILLPLFVANTTPHGAASKVCCDRNFAWTNATRFDVKSPKHDPEWDMDGAADWRLFPLYLFSFMATVVSLSLAFGCGCSSARATPISTKKIGGGIRGD